MNRIRILLCVLVAFFVGVQESHSQSRGAVACGELYTVARGDTLRDIALRAYRRDDFDVIFRVNARVLPSPNLLEVGQQIFVPCLDARGEPAPGQTRAAAVALAAAPPPPTTLAALAAAPGGQGRVVPGELRIKFLTGGDYAPFTDEDLPEGGLFTDLVKRTMQRAAPELAYRITFVNDWRPHLSILLPEGPFDLGFPWFKPDCSKVDRLSEEMAARCTDFDFSDPFYQVAVGFYAMKGSAAAAAGGYPDLLGLTICRPAGYFTFDLEQENLRAPAVAMVSPGTPEECFELLAKGEVDVVSLNVQTSRQAIDDLEMTETVAEIEPLKSAQTLHVLAPKNNPMGGAYLAMINRGLTKVRESGEWFSVVSWHLAEQAKRTQ